MAEEDLHGEWKELARRVDGYRSSLPPEEPEPEQEPQEVSGDGYARVSTKTGTTTRNLLAPSVVSAGGGYSSANGNFQKIDAEILALNQNITGLRLEMVERDRHVNGRIDGVLNVIRTGRNALKSFAFATAFSVMFAITVLITHGLF